ncbi:MAG: methionyl aminopeptidase [Planctomycetota bacterium]|nr:MAG: methionyl aminopeptidase [Planctomycetota bacterium]
MRHKPGRNDPCHCGSGKKYKRCHMDRDGGRAPARIAPPPTRRRRRRRTDHLVLTEGERDAMRAAGAANAEAMDFIRDHVRPGAVLSDLDDLVREWTYDHGYVPACLGYKGYPKSICASVNEVVCHGIPDDYALREGDIVNLDLTTIVDGWHGDQSETFLVGEVSEEARRVTQCAFDCLYLGIEAIGPGSKVLEIGRAIVARAHADGFSVVEDFQGHGIGRSFHQDPGIPHYPDSYAGQFVLEPGMCFTIEPMINVGVKGCRIDKRDGWTARTRDGKLSAQFEHTLLMTEDGVEILTQTRRGPRPGHRF